ncbi:MAG TPA: hypothetical protein VNG90_01170 [Candidatus Acidoferrum sp.]|nr:hypothetical protein [Candidatus Acidoferrum sp.]
MSTGSLGGFESRLRLCALFIIHREQHVVDLHDFLDQFKGLALTATIDALRLQVEGLSNGKLSIRLVEEELCGLHDEGTVHIAAGSQFKTINTNAVVQELGEGDELYAFGPTDTGITFASRATEEQQRQYRIEHDENLQIAIEVESLFEKLRSYLYVQAGTLEKEQGEAVIAALATEEMTLEVISRAARLLYPNLLGSKLETVIREAFRQ